MEIASTAKISRYLRWANGWGFWRPNFMTSVASSFFEGWIQENTQLETTWSPFWVSLITLVSVEVGKTFREPCWVCEANETLCAWWCWHNLSAYSRPNHKFLPSRTATRHPFKSESCMNLLRLLSTAENVTLRGISRVFTMKCFATYLLCKYDRRAKLAVNFSCPRRGPFIII